MVDFLIFIIFCLRFQYLPGLAWYHLRSQHFGLGP